MSVKRGTMNKDKKNDGQHVNQSTINHQSRQLCRGEKDDVPDHLQETKSLPNIVNVSHILGNKSKQQIKFNSLPQKSKKCQGGEISLQAIQNTQRKAMSNPDLHPEAQAQDGLAADAESVDLEAIGIDQDAELVGHRIQSIDPDADAADSSTIGTDPDAEAVDIRVQSTDPDADAADPITTGTDPDAEAVDIRVQSTDPDADAADPITTGTDPDAEAVDIRVQSTDPIADAADPSTTGTDPDAEAVDKRVQSTDPDADTINNDADAEAVDHDAQAGAIDFDENIAGIDSAEMESGAQAIEKDAEKKRIAIQSLQENGYKDNDIKTAEKVFAERHGNKTFCGRDLAEIMI
ncbi:putative surface protein SACOL0050 [Ruditapes philippinarum]|uniref:putative surface protein SACOL0050 n=1 Tax=Ruditapes philippinarum TaxID=129788 RepID=UPI00295BA708|nr:putative surface protein SACOL0050 [Ruditapes philippinarum]